VWDKNQLPYGRENMTIQFRDWLLQNQQQLDPRCGDLAADALQDIKYPWAESYASQRRYLIAHNACDGALTALHIAHAAYRQRQTR